MIGDKMREEGMRNNEINSELNRMKSEKARNSELAQEDLRVLDEDTKNRFLRAMETFFEQGT